MEIKIIVVEIYLIKISEKFKAYKTQQKNQGSQCILVNLLYFIDHLCGNILKISFEFHGV